MMSLGASAVIASDVGSVRIIRSYARVGRLTKSQIDDNSPRNFGDSVSGWWLVINRWNPFSNARSVPAITEIQSRLA
jgi:lysophospholipid hydrolase